MSRLAIAAAAVFGVLLIALGAVGAASQVRLDRQVALLATKEAALVDLAARTGRSRSPRGRAPPAWCPHPTPPTW